MSQRTIRFLFLAPALTVLAVFFVYPILLTFYYSFTDFTGVGSPEYAGLKNYERIAARSRYPEALKITLLFTVIVVTVRHWRACSSRPCCSACKRCEILPVPHCSRPR